MVKSLREEALDAGKVKKNVMPAVAATISKARERETLSKAKTDTKMRKKLEEDIVGAELTFEEKAALAKQLKKKNSAPWKEFADNVAKGIDGEVHVFDEGGSKLCSPVGAASAINKDEFGVLTAILEKDVKEHTTKGKKTKQAEIAFLGGEKFKVDLSSLEKASVENPAKPSKPHQTSQLSASSENKSAFVLKVDRFVMIAVAEQDPQELVQGLFTSLMKQAGIY